MNPWIFDPAWQNFSSMYREAITATEAKTSMERSHHVVAALYFGIAALEAFLNDKMREHLNDKQTEGEIVRLLRRERFLTKVKSWPAAIHGNPPPHDSSAIDIIEAYYEIRGDTTHPKTHGHEIADKIDFVKPEAIVEAVAEFIVRFYEAQKTQYPYWVFGWNYLNPRTDSYDIDLLHSQQFLFSLQALGFAVPAAVVAPADAWRAKFLGTHAGYSSVRAALAQLDRCEPKFDRFPFRPTLCRRWWTEQHHRSCGHVSQDAIQKSL